MIRRLIAWLRGSDADDAFADEFSTFIADVSKQRDEALAMVKNNLENLNKVSAEALHYREQLRHARTAFVQLALQFDCDGIPVDCRSWFDGCTTNDEAFKALSNAATAINKAIWPNESKASL